MQTNLMCRQLLCNILDGINTSNVFVGPIGSGKEINMKSLCQALEDTSNLEVEHK